MERNVGRLDQFVRIILGFAVLAFMVKDGALIDEWPLLAIIGSLLLATAGFAYCPLYSLFGTSTGRKHGQS